MENDDESISACKKKLSQFRIKELKDILGQVGLSKQGKKQDLMDRILALLYDEGTPGLFKNNVNGKEGLVEIIDETYRNMQEATPNDSAAKKPNSSGGSRLWHKEEADDSYQLERKIQCPCGRDLPSLPLIQCMDIDCNVCQHTNCVIIPEKPTEKLPIPAKFLCEICRLRRADPFWATMAHPLYPVKLAASSIPVDGTNPHVSVERTFKLTRADRDLLLTMEYDVQVWCMLFNDAVPFRIQWPQYAGLQVNGVPVKTVNRPDSQQLGANGRDDSARIKSCIVEGVNKISLSFADARIFCFGVRLVRRRLLEQVFGMIPKEADGESFEDALSRVQRCIGGGIATGNDNSDSDLEVIADSVTVSLRCPMSGCRMKTAGRFRACAHMGCFDLESFVAINERTRKWQCPICLKNYSLEDLIIDPFFNRILNLMQHCEEEINEIDMKPDGSWRVKRGRDAGDLSKWHSPNGSAFSLSDSGQEHLPDDNTSTQGTQCIANGCHAVLDSHMNQGSNEALNHDLNIITMSSTTTGNGEDDGDPSINQDGNEQCDVSTGNEPEISSGFNRFGQTQGRHDQSSGLPIEEADIIVLSDSEDDDVNVIYPESVPVVNPPKYEGYSSSAPDPSYPADALTCPDGDHLIPQPLFPSNLPGGSGFDFFGTSDALSDEHNTVTCAEPAESLFMSDTTLNPAPLDTFDPHNSTFENHFGFLSGTISMETLHPCPSLSRNDLPQLNSSPGEDLISVRTRGNGHESSSSNVEAHHESADEILLGSHNLFRSDEDSSIPTAHGDSGSGSRSESGSDLTLKRKMSHGPFSFPRQQRSSRRLVLRTEFSNLLSR